MGRKLKNSHKTVVKLTLGPTTLEVKLYILPHTHIDVIIGCDILKRFGAVIDFSNNQIRFSKSMSGSMMSREHGLGFLEYVPSKPMTPVQCTSVDSHIIPLKSDRRIVLKSDKVIIPGEMIKHDVRVHETLTLQFQTEFNKNDRVSEIVTIVNNEDNQPLCLLPNKTLLSLTDPEINR